MAERSLGRRITRFLIWIVMLWFGATLLTVLALRWLDPPTSAFMMSARIDALADGDRRYRTRYEWVDYSTHLPQRRDCGDRSRRSTLRRARGVRSQVDR